MSRREYEEKALDMIAGRISEQPGPVAKRKLSGIVMLSVCLWAAAIAVIGAVAIYVYLKP